VWDGLERRGVMKGRWGRGVGGGIHLGMGKAGCYMADDWLRWWCWEQRFARDEGVDEGEVGVMLRELKREDG
jgi:hypothetical protein